MAEWEKYAILLANCKSERELVSVISDIIQNENIIDGINSQVGVGRDTRPSGVLLLEAVKDGILISGGAFEDYGVVTTPQCHYLVASSNYPEYGEKSCQGYYKKLAGAWQIITVSSQFTDQRREKINSL